MRSLALAIAGAGVLVLVVDAAAPFLPHAASSGSGSRSQLEGDPAAGGGQPADEGFVWVTASAYGGPLEGRETACGETLRPASEIVASTTLECGTAIDVRLGDTTVDATVGDRGPFVEGRDLDLAPGVWRGLGFTSIAEFGVRGVQVRVE